MSKKITLAIFLFSLCSPVLAGADCLSPDLNDLHRYDAAFEGKIVKIENTTPTANDAHSTTLFNVIAEKPLKGATQNQIFHLTYTHLDSELFPERIFLVGERYLFVAHANKDNSRQYMLDYCGIWPIRPEHKANEKH
jgi:hypothetical protein